MWLSWRRPSSHDESSYLSRCQTTNYDSKYVGATSGAPFTNEEFEGIKKDGFVINHSRIKIGRGREAFVKGTESLKSWGHLQLGWASVDANTPVKVGVKFGIRVRELFAWIINPLQIVYINDDLHDSKDKLSPTPQATNEFPKEIMMSSTNKSTYAFGSGTLQGHLLAGEERFSIEWNKDDDSVWYEIFSFSKPAHILAVAGFPVVRMQQKLFAKQSTEAMAKMLTSTQDN